MGNGYQFLEICDFIMITYFDGICILSLFVDICVVCR